MIRDETTVTDETGTFILTNVYFRCTDCGDIKVASDFGLRKMGDGTTRNQSQCSACRSKYRESK